MRESFHCPGCGTNLEGLVIGHRGATCPKCRAILPPSADDYNPYSPPTSSFEDRVEDSFETWAIPSSVFGKYGLTFRLLGAHFPLFTLIVSTIWLPANSLIESMEANALPGQEGTATVQFNHIFQGFFGPIILGAVIFSLSKIVHGQRVGYLEAIGGGFRNWGRLFIANFVAGLIIILGMIALIVPGIIMQVRFALLDSVVVLERRDDPRLRSTMLTSGRRWPIFWAYILFFLGFLPLSTGVVYAVSMLDSPDQPVINVVIACLFDVVALVLTIVMFLFYCEARQDEEAKGRDIPDDQLIKARMAEFLGEEGEETR